MQGFDSVSPVGDVELVPDPCDVIGCHRVVRIVPCGSVFEPLEPGDKLIAAFLRFSGLCAARYCRAPEPADQVGHDSADPWRHG